MDEERELPLGLAFQMAMNEKAFARFSDMGEQEKQSVIDRAKNVKSRREMERLVESLEKME